MLVNGDKQILVSVTSLAETFSWWVLFNTFVVLAIYINTCIHIYPKWIWFTITWVTVCHWPYNRYYQILCVINCLYIIQFWAYVVYQLCDLLDCNIHYLLYLTLIILKTELKVSKFDCLSWSWITRITFF